MEHKLNKLAKVERKQNGLKKIALIGGLGLATGAFAGGTTDTQDSFYDLFQLMSAWMQGSLGKVIAIFGFIGTFILYAMTHRGSVLFIGVLISLIAGGLVGIVLTFFNIGQQSFKTYSS